MVDRDVEPKNFRKYTRAPDKIENKLVHTTSEEIASTGLTELQYKFCHHYVNSLNATDAAIQAGYSPNNANVRGCRLLQHTKVQEYIAKLGEERIRKINQNLKRIHVSKDRVLTEMAYIAFFDPRDIFDDNGNLKKISDWPEEAARALGTINNKELFEGTGEDRVQIGELKTVRPWDKLKALEMLAKHLNLFQTNVNIKTSGEVTHKVQVEQIKDKYKHLSVEEREQLIQLMNKAENPPALTEGQTDNEKPIAEGVLLNDNEVIDCEYESMETE